MVNINVFWTRPQDYDSAAWHGTWEFDSGALMNGGTTLTCRLADRPIESVQAYTGTLARNIEVEDSAVLGVKWRSGALGSMNVTMLTYPKNLEGSITILGEKGTVRLEASPGQRDSALGSSRSPRPEDEGIREANYATTSVYGFGHPLYYDNVINVLRGEAEPETDGREGLKSLGYDSRLPVSTRWQARCPATGLLKTS
ncbi:MAG: Gfo/Idh/MocA family oxidoreductase [Pseudomonadales bacterium]